MPEPHSELNEQDIDAWLNARLASGGVSMIALEPNSDSVQKWKIGQQAYDTPKQINGSHFRSE